MMRLCTLLLFTAMSCGLVYAQPPAKKTIANLSKPKLVIGLVVDQMRWDYLYKFYNRYAAEGGFKKLLNKGFTCENTFIDYAPTVTAAGHACIYTGSVPAINGITGNDWWDNVLQRNVYCTEDSSAKTIGSNTIAAGQMSPKNLLTTTLTDELRIANNFRNKTIGIALKDRGSILPAGHTANAAYWYDSKTGNWISSSYYMNALPAWVNNFNEKKLVDKYYAKGWPTLYPINSYHQSTPDLQPYEANAFGDSATQFPYNLSSFIAKNYGKITVTPYGNTLTLDMAKAAIESEQLGADSLTDFLAISFSSTDYIGHAYGPNSVEIEDCYLRLDKDLGDFFTYLDNRLGKANYTCFLTADHGVAQVPGFNGNNKLPGKAFSSNQLSNKLEKILKDKYGRSNWIAAIDNYQITFTPATLDSACLTKEEVINFLLPILLQENGIANAFALSRLSAEVLPVKQRTMFSNGFYKRRSGDIQIILLPGWVAGKETGTTHGLWNPYDAHIPLIFYGWGINQGKTHREIYMTDIAATLSALLHIQMPSGNVGTVVSEALK
jgi:predicted AlkP superfamily pyrophosphatase or phosphodiesterase